MDRGRIVEEGNHQSLAARKDGVYARLATLQFNAGKAAWLGCAKWPIGAQLKIFCPATNGSSQSEVL